MNPKAQSYDQLEANNRVAWDAFRTTEATATLLAQQLSESQRKVEELTRETEEIIAIMWDFDIASPSKLREALTVLRTEMVQLRQQVSDEEKRAAFHRNIRTDTL